ncbi:hypothetical protein THRCLA_23190 [Thraustotheca clavata]|uniref:Uncharacterized protein n=1 Tax=Thraustotheca clavata TaxID=74557 RepID=A0A1V9YBL3_9STRA|nr:hypothetical protein THRCLA_23190 [Thraustotheca clavata]
MKTNQRKLPFFILDEMSGIDAGGFRCNIFCACELIVIAMGTDSKINNLTIQSECSYAIKHHWMSLVPRFPAYQLEEQAEQSRLAQRFEKVFCLGHTLGQKVSENFIT